ncbi:MAG: DUF4194 domain-containing protein [Spirochaetaceae bacterium]|jgi:hypothetical protein|nr:DUF4194 domain-containing protein [Spirochaetaceae bacterium]
MKEVKEYAPVIIQLLKGVISHEEKEWNELLIHQKAVAQYLSQIGLELHLHESDGYAYLLQMESDPDSDEIPLPRLVRRHPLNFEVSLLCVLLREEMDVFDISGSDSSKCFISIGDIRDRLQIYFKDNVDQIRLYRELDQYIRRVDDLGLIKQVNRNRENQKPLFQILPLIKSRIDGDFLAEFKRKLKEYVDSL